MGQDKANVLVRGSTMLETVTAAVEPVSDRVIVLGPDREGWECWPDSVHAQGPLAGVATALSRTDTSHILLVAVDHPFVTSETLGHLVDMADDLPIVPVDDHGVRQVTCAIYPKSIAEAAAEEARNGGSVQSLLDRVSFTAVTADQWRSWGEDGRSWFSADDPQTLSEGLAHYQSG
jgi:molybdopterin-guanine dinucleotide biosynthesis protein A